MPEPGAIHEHPRREGIRGVDNRLRHLQPSTAVPEGPAVLARHRHELPRHGVTGTIGIPPQKNSRLIGLIVHEHHRAWRRGRRGHQPGFHFLEQSLIHALRRAVGKQRQESPAEEKRDIGGGSFRINLLAQFLFRVVRQSDRWRLLLFRRLLELLFPVGIDTLEKLAVNGGNVIQGGHRLFGQSLEHERIDRGVLLAKQRNHPRRFLAELFRRNIRQDVPRMPHRMRRRIRLLQIVLPAHDHRRVKLPRICQQHEVFDSGLLPGGIGGQEVLRTASPRSGDDGGMFFLHEGVQLLLAAGQLEGELGIILPFGRRRHEFRQHQRLAAAAEDAVEGVVVGRGDGVVFVVVAAGTGDGQPHQAAGDDVDPVVQDVVYVPHVVRAEGEKPHRRQRPLVFAKLQLVRRQLLHDEAVKGAILVERADNVIAVGVGPGIILLLEEDISLIVRIASHIEPVPAPSLSIAGRSQQAVDKSRPGVRRWILLKLGNFFVGRWKSEQIKVSTTNERSFVRLR